jgi:hypothetical protein
MAKKQWTHDELLGLFNRHAGELAPVIAAHPEIIGMSIDIDGATGKPFLKIVVSELSTADTTDIPAAVGPPGDELPVRLEYRPQARLG